MAVHEFPETIEDGLNDIDLASMKAIEIYQNHLQISDRLWAYFSQYSGLLIVVGLGFVALRSFPTASMPPTALIVLPLIAYLVFCAGNLKAMSHTLRELNIVRSVAIAKTRLNFSGHATGTIMRFQVTMTCVVGLAYLGCTWFAIGGPSSP